jgi:hypothetical protein
MTATWCPWAQQDKFQDAGGFYDSPWRGVLHTTEGDTYAAARSAYGAGVAPHFTVSFEGGTFRAWQHISLDRAARALMHPQGTVETNRLRCIQIEIVAHAASSGTLQHQYLDGIGKLMRWIESNTGIPRRAGVQFHGSGEGITLAVTNSPIRLSPGDWSSFSGWCGHQHVPVNDHWDPGAIDINYLLGVEVGVKPMIDPPLDMHQVVSVRGDKYTDRGVYVLQEDGAVFAFDGAVYYKGANGESFFANRKAAALLWPEEAAQIHPEMGNFANYKYVIQDTANELYGRP